MSFYKRITLKWSYPIEFNNILEKDSMNDIGIYYISRKFGNSESILYIGKTIDKFKHRLKDHDKKWLDTYRGRKYVRLGRIVSPKNISENDLYQLINDAEKTIIFYLSNLDEHKLIANVVSTKSSKFDYTLKIENIGFKGQLPGEIYIPKEWLKLKD